MNNPQQSETSITGKFKSEWPESRRHNYPCSFESAVFAALVDLEAENQRLLDQVSKLTSSTPGSPFADEGCAFTYADWMQTRQKALDELDQWRKCAAEFNKFVCSEIVVGNPDRYVRIKELVAAFDKLNTP